nr:hypothetical protein [bacterium]
MITIHNQQKALPIDIDGVRLFAIEMLHYLEISTDEFIIHFITEEKTKFLHSLFFDDPTTTDCMTFPIDGTEEKYREADFDNDPELENTLAAIGTREVRQRKIKRKRVHKYIMSGGKVLEDAGYIAGNCIPIVP